MSGWLESVMVSCLGVASIGTRRRLARAGMGKEGLGLDGDGDQSAVPLSFFMNVDFGPEVVLDTAAIGSLKFSQCDVAFGRGAHLCLGNHLSRLDMEVIFLSLFQRTATIELNDPSPPYKAGLSVRGPTSLNIRVRR